MAAVPPTAWGSLLMPGLCLRALNRQQVPGCLWAPWSRNVPPEHPQTRLPQQTLGSPSSPSAMSSRCTVVFPARDLSEAPRKTRWPRACGPLGCMALPWLPSLLFIKCHQDLN